MLLAGNKLGLTACRLCGLSFRWVSVSTASSAATIAADEKKSNVFSQDPARWWDKTGAFKALHSFNRLRVPAIKDALLSNRSELRREDLHILDVGCGAGILSEALCRVGFRVTAIDQEPALVGTATEHAIRNGLRWAIDNGRLNYSSDTTVERLVDEGAQFDGVVASEVVEHVPQQRLFLEQCCSLVKPGGVLFISSINKTIVSYLTAILLAENLGIVPRGAHQWSLFISPEDVDYILERNGLSSSLICGTVYNPLTNRWSWTDFSQVNFVVVARRLP